MNQRTIKTIIFGAAAAIFIVGCSKPNRSVRDTKLEQMRAQAEQKRNELKQVVDHYVGTFSFSNGRKQKVCLNLEIKDVPSVVEGEVDPVMVPTLTGSLHFNFGDCDKSSLPFGIQKGDFDAKNEKVDLVVNNSEHGNIKINLTHRKPELTGEWNAPEMGASGTIFLRRGAPENTETLSGEYGGVLFRNKDFYQFGHLTLRTTFQSPDGFKVSANARVIFGAWDSKEYLTYRFEEVRFNPIRGELTMKSEASDLSFTVILSEGELFGKWTSVLVGDLSSVQFKKSWIPPALPSHGELYEPLQGSYQGTLKNGSGFNYPKKVMVSLVTSQDLTEPNGLKITGNFRFYIGEFGSTAYFEYPFEEIKYDSFTKQFIGKTVVGEGNEKFTILGNVDNKKLGARLKSDGVGEVATLEMGKP